MLVASVVSVLAASVLVTSVAAAKKPEDVYGGKVLVSSAPFPTSAKSEAAYVAALKKNVKTQIIENKETQEWQVFYVAFFKQPAPDPEVSIRMYDVTGGARRLVSTFEQYLSSTDARAYVSAITLKRGDGSQGYDPNTQIEMVVQSRTTVLAKAQFQLVGEARKYKGVVDFSEDEKQ